MNIVVAVDAEERYRAALQLCLRLGFPNPNLFLAHAVKPIAHVVPSLAPVELTSEVIDQALQEIGEKVVNRAASMVPKEVASEQVVRVTRPIQFILGVAEKTVAPLIVLGSGHKGRASYYFGSVGRALAVGASQSLLVVKERPKRKQSLTAVFATDHSEYASRCLDQFCQWAPKGIETVHLVTAYDLSQATKLKRKMHVALDVEQVLMERLTQLTCAAAAKLEKAGYKVKQHILPGHPNTVLPDCMDRYKGDLLVVGAQGHGFLSQLFIGSVSLHQLANESYPVLLIRV